MLKLLDVLVLLEVGVEIDVLVLRAKQKTTLSTPSRGDLCLVVKRMAMIKLWVSEQRSSDVIAAPGPESTIPTGIVLLFCC